VNPVLAERILIEFALTPALSQRERVRVRESRAHFLIFTSIQV
jgi:hypothetical protein